MASPVKRTRRTKAQLEHLQHRLLTIIAAEYPMSVRQVYYAGVVRGLYPKTEQNYNFVCRELAKLRRAGRLPYEWLADNTRWVRLPQTYGGVEEVLESAADHYRKSIWRYAPVNVEIWIEKEALAGVVVAVTREYAAPLYVTRGYASMSYLYEAAQSIARAGKPTHIYYLGDYDPSGVDIPVKVEQALREYAPEADIRFTRAAINPQQIEAYNLPTRPTKRSDSRAKGFGAHSVELDALPANTLRAMVRELIEQHIDPRQLAEVRRTEKLERETLYEIAERFRWGQE